jgi:trk system potassium uptake protein
VTEEHVLGVPISNTRVQATDTLVVFGTTKNIERLIEINQ